MFDPKDNLTITQDGDLLFAKAVQDGIETVWDRHEAQQPQCGFCDMGLSCRICIMGPCRVDPFGEGPQTGVCGADADIIVARNLCRMVAAGAASHSDHGRDLVEVLAGVADGRPSATRSAMKPNSGAWPRSTVSSPTERHPDHRRGAGPGHDGRLRHAPKGHQMVARAPEKRGRCGRSST
jgi:hydroxylamine reductase (hybrid-cluster protein)